MQVKNKERFDGLIFDLDGTLWDASAACAKAWNKSLRDLGHEHQVDDVLVRSVSGLRIEIIFKEYFGFIPEEKHKALLDAYKVNEKIFVRELGGDLFPQVKETLLALRKHYPPFVVSNCLAGYIENFLAFHNLENVFTDFECSGKTGLPKSENIRLIIQRNGLQQPVYIGDTIWDQEAARKANVPFIFAAYGFGNVGSSEMKIDSIADLSSLLESLPALP
jgi:phosphoglycolate phosphatase